MLKKRFLEGKYNMNSVKPTSLYLLSELTMRTSLMYPWQLTIPQILPVKIVTKERNVGDSVGSCDSRRYKGLVRM